MRISSLLILNTLLTYLEYLEIIDQWPSIDISADYNKHRSQQWEECQVWNIIKVLRAGRVDQEQQEETIDPSGLFRVLKVSSKSSTPHHFWILMYLRLIAATDCWDCSSDCSLTVQSSLKGQTELFQTTGSAASTHSNLEYERGKLFEYLN